jgi:fatty-acid desaturase
MLNARIKSAALGIAAILLACGIMFVLPEYVDLSVLGRRLSNSIGTYTFLGCIVLLAAGVIWLVNGIEGFPGRRRNDAEARKRNWWRWS